jgi:hypothetical protein
LKAAKAKIILSKMLEPRNMKDVSFVKRVPLTFAEFKERRKSDSLVADNYELLKGNDEYNNKAADLTSSCSAKTRLKTCDVTSPQEWGNDKVRIDDRTSSEEKFRVEVCEENRFLSEQQEDLYNVMAKNRQELK